MHSGRKKYDAMKLLYLDCFAGLSFGMLPGALLDMGLADSENFSAALQGMGLKNVRVSRVSKSGIDACSVFVSPADDIPKTAAELENGMFSANLPARAKRLAAGVLDKLAAAGVTRFSAQEAAEAVCDIAGTALLLDAIQPDFCMASEVRFDAAAAGAQAILDAYRIPHRTKEGAAALSPVGAALLAQLVQEYGALPAMQISRIGYGAAAGGGDKPHLLRAVLGKTDDTLGDMECSVELLYEQAMCGEVTV